MNDLSSGHEHYAHLPEELMAKILEDVPNTVEKMNKMFEIQEEPLKNAIDSLRQSDMTKKITSTEYSSSLIAVDGGVVVDKMTGSDLLLAVAVGVEGLSEDPNAQWGAAKNQYYQWQTVLPHEEATARLAQGVMFLMELSVLAQADHEIRILDGTHFTPILKVNSMLSAKEDNAGKKYIQALKDFLRKTYQKIIPDIPDIVREALQNPAIIANAKYSSSRDVLDQFVQSFDIVVDDKTFFSLALDENEYLSPLSVGQSKNECRKIWNDLHIKCNLEIEEKDQLNSDFKKILYPIITKDKKSDLYFTYYKPYAEGPAYRIELKKELALDNKRLERVLLSLRHQIVFPEILEPYPQYLVDLMAKSVASGLFAIQEGIKLSPLLKADNSNFNLIFNYRTK